MKAYSERGNNKQFKFIQFELSSLGWRCKFFFRRISRLKKIIVPRCHIFRNFLELEQTVELEISIASKNSNVPMDIDKNSKNLINKLLQRNHWDVCIWQVDILRMDQLRVVWSVCNVSEMSRISPNRTTGCAVHHWSFLFENQDIFLDGISVRVHNYRIGKGILIHTWNFTSLKLHFSWSHHRIIIPL